MLSTTVSLTCDRCKSTLELEDGEDSLSAHGWVFVERYNIVEDEIEELDFCGNLCLVSFFSLG